VQGRKIIDHFMEFFRSRGESRMELEHERDAANPCFGPGPRGRLVGVDVGSFEARDRSMWLIMVKHKYLLSMYSSVCLHNQAYFYDWLSPFPFSPLQKHSTSTS
jgi:hypothetical protein